MEFDVVLAKVSAQLDGQGTRFGLAGAAALQAYGLTRATADLDLVVERSGQPLLLGFVDGLGYERLHVSDGYSNHLHRDASFGRLDFIYVDGPTADVLFAEARVAGRRRGVDQGAVRAVRNGQQIR